MKDELRTVEFIRELILNSLRQVNRPKQKKERRDKTRMGYAKEILIAERDRLRKENEELFRRLEDLEKAIKMMEKAENPDINVKVESVSAIETGNDGIVTKPKSYTFFEGHPLAPKSLS